MLLNITFQTGCQKFQLVPWHVSYHGTNWNFWKPVWNVREMSGNFFVVLWWEPCRRVGRTAGDASGHQETQGTAGELRTPQERPRTDVNTLRLPSHTKPVVHTDGLTVAMLEPRYCGSSYNLKCYTFGPETSHF